MRPGIDRWITLTPLLFGPFAASCFVDDDRCAQGQVELSEGVFGACTCPEGSVPTADNKTCMPCGAFEVAMNGMCQCMAGYQKSGGVCMPVPDTGPMVGDDAGAGDAGGPPSRLTGTNGQGKSCATPADCAGTDATFCLPLGAMPMCLVQDCGVNGTRSCAPDRVCCDVANSLLGNALPAAKASNGLCLDAPGCTQAGGTAVTP